METLSPVKSFLRVANKRFGLFAMFDEKLESKGATLVYLYLFWAAAQRDHCWPTQETLATVSKSSVRSVQAYIKELIALGYIRVERRGKHNVYRLLLSEHVKSVIGEAGIEMITEALRNYAETEGDSTGAEFAPMPASTGANSAYRSKSKIQQETNTPLSPLPALPLSGVPTASAAVGGGSPCSPLQKHPEGGGSRRAAPLAASGTVMADFERLFSAWPHKQDKLASASVYGRLARTGRLPDIDTLLAVVERMKAEDRHWQAGYVPNLKFWLLNERWDDEPIAAMSAPKPWQGSATPSQPYVPTEVDPKLQEAVQALHKRLEREQVDARKEGSPPDELTRTVDALCGLWPSAQRKHVLAGLGLAHLRGGINLSNVVGRAREYIGGLAGAMQPMPVGDWLRSAGFNHNGGLYAQS